ncbi:MAG TPA: DUF3466 family protein [Kiritimatiellia bacterium]|nr:DUF3466 family protein [Kiritimatiellia bacterium]
MISFARFKIVLIAASCMSLLSPAHGQIGHVIDLGTLGGSASQANALNDAGQVVGWAHDTNDVARAFLWDNGVMQDLGTLPGGVIAEARDINESGRVVGWSDTTNNAGGTRGFTWDGAVMTELGTLGGQSSRAYGMNEGGETVGWAMTNNATDPMACLYTAGATTELGRLYPKYSSEAWDVNSKTQVVGESFVFAPDEDWHAFFWQDTNGNHVSDAGEMIGLGVLGTNGRFSRAYAINDQGIVVGGADVSFNAPEWVRHAFMIVPENGIYMRDTNGFWANELLIDLGTLGGKWAEATDINERNMIVGYSTTADGATNAFLWQGGTMANLNSMIPTNSGWVLTHAWGINENGDVAGVGIITGATHAFLLRFPLSILSLTTERAEWDVTNVIEGATFTQRASRVEGHIIRWSDPWTPDYSNFVFTVESRGIAPTSTWNAVVPTDQWPTLEHVWTNDYDAALPGRFFRVRADSVP